MTLLERGAIMGGVQPAPQALPTGTLTFVLSDVVGSSRLWELYPDEMLRATAKHDELIDHIAQQHGGVLVRPRGEGDSRFVVFTHATGAVAAAVEVQLALEHEAWPMPEPLHIRIGVHTGEAEARDGDYYGSAVNRCARVRDLGAGGQILLSAATTQLVRQRLSSGLSVRYLGTIPLPGLSEAESVYQLVHPNLASEFPPLRSVARLDNLPLELPSLVGRSEAVDHLTSVLTTARLVTLTGTGGVGKTRLALEVARRLRDAFPGGVWLVELAPETDPKLVPQAVAIALNVREVPRESLATTLARALADKDMLLVLDNCEHVLNACAELVTTFLQACPHVHILATSREPLDIVAEHIWPVPMLEVPHAGDAADLLQVASSPAVRLLVERIVAVQPAFILTRDNVDPALEICRRLDGIPLAIELAARRATTLTLEQIAFRLRDSFAVLSRAHRGAPTRHRTLGATIAWSYDLLEPTECRLFERVSVFAGEFTLDAVEAVCCGDSVERHQVLDVLQRLVEMSLVHVRFASGQARFRLLGALREFGAERLEERGDTSARRERHAAHYLAWAADTPQPWAFSGFRFDRIERLEIEHDDLRMALDWLTGAGRVREALLLATSMTRAWSIRGVGGEMLTRLLRLLSDERSAKTHERALALRAAGRLAWEHGDPELRQRMSSEAVAIFRALDDNVGVVVSLQDLGSVASHSGRYVEAQAVWTKTLHIIEERGLPAGLQPRSLMGLAAVAAQQGDFVTARSYLGAALTLVESVTFQGDASAPVIRAQALQESGLVALYEGDLQHAAEVLNEALQLEVRLRDPREQAVTLALLGLVARAAGQPDAARAYFRESLAVESEPARGPARILVLEGFAGLLAVSDPVLAFRAAGAADALRASLARPASLMDARLLDNSLTAARGALRKSEAEAAWDKGRGLPADVVLRQLEASQALSSHVAS